MKGAGGGTIEKIQNKNGGSPAEKKKNLFLAAALMLSSAAAHADEGMWTLYNLPQAVYEQMKSYGFSPSYDQLYKSDDAIKNAVVNFSGFCSGFFNNCDSIFNGYMC